MSNRRARNMRVFKIGLTSYSKSVVEPQLLAMCVQVAQRMVKYIDGVFPLPVGTQSFPVETSNLHDATGVGVYSSGVMRSFVPTKRAAKPQSDDNGEHTFFGENLLKEAISSASARFSKGIWIVLFSAVPYAYRVNIKGSPASRGRGFFAKLEQALLSDVISGLKPIGEL